MKSADQHHLDTIKQQEERLLDLRIQVAQMEERIDGFRRDALRWRAFADNFDDLFDESTTLQDMTDRLDAIIDAGGMP
jgi:Mg2+ and Co2+ transporter CorA